mmetsp:Transcript_25779/g.54649  ORF Transcript_25779/g.54649 Transcript_25779/m.54649 type:complete len:94 (-) Transcript_25779:212-493(-)
MTTGARRIPLAGDVKVSIFSPKGKMAVFWFHTAFVSNGKLRLMKAELDKACKEKKLYRDDFGVEVTFSRTPAEDEEGHRASIERMLTPDCGWV